jgi:hypothetical protein
MLCEIIGTPFDECFCEFEVEIGVVALGCADDEVEESAVFLQRQQDGALPLRDQHYFNFLLPHHRAQVSA